MAKTAGQWLGSILADATKRKLQDIGDERERRQHMQRALDNAELRGLAQFTTNEQRDMFTAILDIFSSSDATALRTDVLRLYLGSYDPEIEAVVREYNLAEQLRQRFPGMSAELLDPVPYVRVFFQYLSIELYVDPIFHQFVNSAVRDHALLATLNAVQDIRAILAETQDTYTPEQFSAECARYIEHLANSLRRHRISAISLPLNDQTEPELGGIYVPLRI